MGARAAASRPARNCRRCAPGSPVTSAPVAAKAGAARVADKIEAVRALARIEVARGEAKIEVVRIEAVRAATGARVDRAGMAVAIAAGTVPARADCRSGSAPCLQTTPPASGTTRVVQNRA